MGVCALIAISLAFLLGASQARATSLIELLERTVESHDRVESARYAVTAAKARAQSAVKDWYPTFDQTATYGYENINNPASEDTQSPFYTLDLKLTQLLWDFGATNTAIETERLNLLDAELQLVAARQDLILEGAQAYVNLLRSYQVVEYALQSEENIRKQTELEDARVETGSGLSTDVLQAKTQLAGAEARRIQSQGALISARNRFRAVFDEVPDTLADLDGVDLPIDWLPPDLGSAISIAQESNTDLALANVAETISREDLNSTRQSEFFPTLNGSIERNTKRNSGGTLGTKEETIAKLELTYSFNLGAQSLDNLRASQADLAAQTATVADTLTSMEETIRNDWSSLNIARSTASSLTTQSQIAKAFLDLAREERQLGQRSLIDVLSGETAYINALSDAASAETDVLLAAFSMLRNLGKLNYESFKPRDVKTLEDLERVSQAGIAKGFAATEFPDDHQVHIGTVLGDALKKSPENTVPTAPTLSESTTPSVLVDDAPTGSVTAARKALSAALESANAVKAAPVTPVVEAPLAIVDVPQAGPITSSEPAALSEATDSAFFVGERTVSAEPLADVLSLSEIFIEQEENSYIQIAAVEPKRTLRQVVAPNSAATPARAEANVPSYSLSDVVSWFSNAPDAAEPADVEMAIAASANPTPVAAMEPTVTVDVAPQTERAPEAIASENDNHLTLFFQALSQLLGGGTEAPSAPVTQVDPPEPAAIQQATVATVQTTPSAENGGVPSYSFDDFATVLSGLLKP